MCFASHHPTRARTCYAHARTRLCTCASDAAKHVSNPEEKGFDLISFHGGFHREWNPRGMGVGASVMGAGAWVRVHRCGCIGVVASVWVHVPCTGMVG